MYVKVTDAPYCAAGNGLVNDRAAIQKAIDDVYAAGGGTVELDAYKTFLTAGLVLQSGVELHFGERAILHQTAARGEYVKPVPGGYEPYLPMLGHNFSDTIKWSHCWYQNYPLLFAPEGSHDFKITGKGTIRMMEVTDPEAIIKVCPIGFYRCSDFEISDIHITNYHGYAMMPFTSRRGIIKNLTVDNWNHGNGDGICLMNCRDIRITGCKMFTGDDTVYIFSSYRDPRRSEWWNSDEPEPSVNIEIDHNDLRSNHCKAFGMILWGIGCPDLQQVEVRSIYVHDNHIETLGNWLWNPYSDKKGNPPVTGLRFENNVIDGIEMNFFETAVSDMTHFRSMAAFENTDFADGLCFWAAEKNGSENCIGICPASDDGSRYAYIQNADKGDVRLYQGVYITAGLSRTFCGRVQAPQGVRLFVRSTDTGETVASCVVKQGEPADFALPFSVPCDGNYRVGFENASSSGGLVKIFNARLGNHERATDYKEVISDGGKLIFKANDALFDRNLHRNQLKMYWFTENELPALTLPEGYSFSHYKDENDIHDWYVSICTGEPGDKAAELAMYKQEITDFTDITPTEDMWFLDYKGEHIGTATSFIYKSTDIGDMHWVGIKKEYRGRGLAKYLSYIVQKTLKERGTPYVSLTTGEGRPAAVKSYLTAGFLPVEYAEGMVKRWEDVLEAFDIDSVNMVDENANPLPPVVRASKAKH